AKFDAGDRLVPIRVQLEDAARGDLPLLEQLRVPLGQHGEKGGVPLSVVADIKLDQGPTSINRYDRERQATVAADLVGSAALGDAIAALLLTGKQLTTPVWIGILMLMGIVTKNAIMLVEFAVESMREGKRRDEAIIDAGMKRARPIVMTTIAMVAGMMPSAL